MKMKSVVIDNIELVLSHPLEQAQEWIGQNELQHQLLACWLIIDKTDLPLTPRIIGKPGVGKTSLAVATAKLRNQPIYIMQCTADTRPEDLLITPVLSQNGTISYHASPLLSAVITGGIAILDEGNRMAEKSWASLASLFDHRRMVESVIAGITVSAHHEFRAAVTMNDDESTFEIPDYIMSRLQPGIEIGFPNATDERDILRYNVSFCEESVLSLCVEYLQKSHHFDLPFSVRDGINAIRYSMKQKKANPQAKTEELFKRALIQILGPEALDLESYAARLKQSGSNNPAEELREMNLGSFFFPDNDSLNPDADMDDEELK
ncbi:MAG: AAA family ATPase [Chitinivibrionales bacterium]|nr:AAA family ATPase [Chitinivibrionales bacterium]